MPKRVIEAALVVSRDRHNFICEGDIEAYSSLEETLAAICAEVATQDLGEDHIPLLNELVGIETQSRAILQSLMDDTSTRLDSLRQRSLANAAYLRSEQASVNPR